MSKRRRESLKAELNPKVLEINMIEEVVELTDQDVRVDFQRHVRRPVAEYLIFSLRMALTGSLEESEREGLK